MVHYVERLTKKTHVSYLADSGFKRAIKVSKGRKKKYFSTISPMTMRKIRGKVEKMQFLGHFWAIFENIHFRPLPTLAVLGGIHF